MRNMMPISWTVLLCLHQAFGSPGFPPENASDNFMLNLLESTYKIVHFEATSEAGEPLLLTPYIQKNQTSEAREAARVDPDEFLGTESYAGYLTVNEEYNANLWFWYIPVSGQPVEEAPWILWLQGGPGASSLFGLFTEIGPFTVSDNHLEKNKYSWGQKQSLLFIDNPVGTGYSFTDDERGFATNQTTVGENLYTAIQQFLIIFPELRAAPLTIAGESYAGKYIPSFGIQILWNKNEAEPINLQGLAIGNGLIDPPTLTNYSEFLLEVGLVDAKMAENIKIIEAEQKTSLDDGDMTEALRLHTSIFEDLIKQTQLPGYNIFNYIDDNHHPDYQPFVEFIQKDKIRRALHVGNTSYADLLNVANHLYLDTMQSARPWLEELLENYRVLLYNGQLDILVGYRPSVNTYNALKFSGASEYQNAERKAWFHNYIVAGFYKVGGHLTEVMVRGAGHMVPADKPYAALGLISAFARGLSLDCDTKYLVEDYSTSR